MRQKAKLALVALAGAAVGVALARFQRPTEAPAEPPDDRAEELRRKLAEARAAFADEDDFEAAGMGAETVVEEPPPAAATPEPPAKPLPKPKPKPKPKPVPPKAPTEPPPRDEFEAMRRRIHEEGKAAAEEMRRSTDTPEQP